MFKPYILPKKTYQCIYIVVVACSGARWRDASASRRFMFVLRRRVKVPGRFLRQKVPAWKGRPPFHLKISWPRSVSWALIFKGGAARHSTVMHSSRLFVGLANRMGLTLTVHPLFLGFSKNKFPRLFRVWVFRKTKFPRLFIRVWVFPKTKFPRLFIRVWVFPKTKNFQDSLGFGFFKKLNFQDSLGFGFFQKLNFHFLNLPLFFFFFF